MKTRSTITVVILLALFALTPPTTVTAATALYFDAEGGTKAWDNITENWSDFSGGPYNRTWVDNCEAYFEGSGGTVNVSGSMQWISAMTFGVGGYTISGGTISPGSYISTAEGTTTIDSEIGGMGNAISKIGSGGLIINSSNGSYGVAVYEGEMSITGDNSLGNIYVESGSLTIGGNNSLGMSIAINGGNLIHSGNSIYEFGNPASYLPTTNIANGTFVSTGAVDLGDVAIGYNGTFRCENASNTSCTSVTLNSPGCSLDINGCNVTIGELNGIGSNVGNVHLGSGTLKLGAGDATYAGVISGEGGKLVIGEEDFSISVFSSQIFTGENTFTGSTTIYNGTLKLSGGDNRLSPLSSVVMADNYSAVLDMSDVNQTISSLSGGGPGSSMWQPGGRIILGNFGTLTVGDENDTTFAGSLMGRYDPYYYGGVLIKQGSGTLTLSGDNYLGGTVINEGAIKLIGTGIDCGLGAITLANTAGASLHIEGTTILSRLNGGGSNGGNVITTGGGDVQIEIAAYAGVISGDANLIIGPGQYIPQVDYTSTLSGANTYQGSTTIFNNATLVLDGGDNRLPVTTSLIFNPGGTLDLNSWTQTVASLSTTGTHFQGSYVNLSSGTLIVDDDNDTEFIGQITGEGTLVKQGSGTLLLGYVDNASVTINEGRLVLDAIPVVSFNMQSVEMANVSGSAILLTTGSNAYVASLNGGGENGGNIEIESMSSNLYVSEGNFGGSITGGGYFTKQGAGTFVLSGLCSTYMVGIENGVLQLDGDNRIAFDTHVGVSGAYAPPSGPVTTGVLDLNGFNQSSRSMSSSVGNNIRLGGGTLSVGYGGIGGAIEGEGNLIKIDSQTSYNKLTLLGVNTYTGSTTVLSGILDVISSLANNGSEKIFLAANDTVFDATISRNIGIDASYAGFGSTAIGDNALGTSADLISGINTVTGKSLSMQWRLRDGDELAAGLVSDVLNLSGMAEEGEATDLFTLQMTYSADALPGGATAETLLADEGKIELVWFNDTESVWQNAALGNFGAENDVQFMGVGYSPDGVLGHWGIDLSTHTVWAVLDHNSQFAVAVPEPGAIAMLAAALLLLAVVGYRRAF